MVSWGKSIYKSFVILGWCFIWGIIGLIIASAAGLTSLWSSLSKPEFWAYLLRNPQYIITVLSESFAGFLIGVVIAFIGQIASFFKVTVDGATGEMYQMKNDLTQLKQEVRRTVSEEQIGRERIAKDLERKISELRNKNSEDIAETREIIRTATLGRNAIDKSDLPISIHSYDATLERLKADLIRDIADKIVEGVDRRAQRERGASSNVYLDDSKI